MKESNYYQTKQMFLKKVLNKNRVKNNTGRGYNFVRKDNMVGFGGYRNTGEVFRTSRVLRTSSVGNRGDELGNIDGKVDVNKICVLKPLIDVPIEKMKARRMEIYDLGRS